MLAAGFGDPVLVVRPQSARPPDRSGRTVGKRRPTLGHPLACTVNQARAFAGGSTSIHWRTLLGGAQSNSRSTAHGEPLSFRAIVAPWGHGRIEVSMPSGVDVLSIPCRRLDAHPLTGSSPALTYMRCGKPAPAKADQLQVPAPSASDLALYSLSRSLVWLAVFKMMHRSGGRQGFGQLLAALAALPDRERSRQNFPSALRAPLTLRLSPGAASFQHQPTRKETT
jgi:hypothetical protein